MKNIVSTLLVFANFCPISLSAPTSSQIMAQDFQSVKSKIHSLHEEGITSQNIENIREKIEEIIPQIDSISEVRIETDQMISQDADYSRIENRPIMHLSSSGQELPFDTCNPIKILYEDYKKNFTHLKELSDLMQIHMQQGRHNELIATLTTLNTLADKMELIGFPHKFANDIQLLKYEWNIPIPKYKNTPYVLLREIDHTSATFGTWESHIWPFFPSSVDFKINVLPPTSIEKGKVHIIMIKKSNLIEACLSDHSVTYNATLLIWAKETAFGPVPILNRPTSIHNSQREKRFDATTCQSMFSCSMRNYMSLQIELTANNANKWKTAVNILDHGIEPD